MQQLFGLLLDVAMPVAIALFVVLPLAGIALGALAAWLILKKVSKKKSERKLTDAERRAEERLADAEKRAKEMLDTAETQAKQIRKEAQLESKEQDIKRRNDFEQEMKEKRAEQQRTEARLNRQEDFLEKKETELNKKSSALDEQREALSHRTQELSKKEEVVARQQELMTQELERVAQLTREEAKKQLTEEILEETRRDCAVQVRNLEQEAKEEADINAKNIISLAIQRCASDHASETTVSVVPLPNDDMKARIIGREGRNIRALENATGIELIIDDTPEVVILSGFDPVRREVARLTLEKLIQDTPLESKKRSKRCKKNSINKSKRRAKTPCSKWAFSGFIPKSSSSSVGLNSVQATGRTYTVIPSRSQTLRDSWRRNSGLT